MKKKISFLLNPTLISYLIAILPTNSKYVDDSIIDCVL